MNSDQLVYNKDAVVKGKKTDNTEKRLLRMVSIL